MNLKPCPFCGGIATIKMANLAWVRCKECGAEGPVAEPNGVDPDMDPNRARALWNKRVGEGDEQ